MGRKPGNRNTEEKMRGKDVSEDGNEEDFSLRKDF